MSDSYDERLKELEEFNELDIYSLRDSVAHFLAPRLRYMADTLTGTPHELEPEEWRAILNKMADAFELAEHWDEIQVVNYENELRIQEGLQLFARWYMHLWT